MTVTSASYTTNSVKITIDNELGSTNIMANVDVAITTLGWTQYDVVDFTVFTPIKTYVYRCLNADGSTYKYFIIRWNVIECRFYTSTCENWTLATDSPVNECWTGSGAFPQGYDIKDSFIWVSATNRHIVIWSFIKNEPGIWTGVMEFERVASEDTAANGMPCWAWTNSLIIGTPWGEAANNTTSEIMFAFPRTADSYTGAAAAIVYAPVTSRGMYPPAYPSGTVAITVDVNLLHLGSYYNIAYGWDTAKTLLSPISVDGIFKSMPFGRAHNFSVTKPIGGFLDTTMANVDATGGWASGSGVSTECVILPMNGGCEADSAYAAGKMAAVYGQTLSVITAGTVAIGDNVWMAASDGIRFWAMTSGQGGSSTLIYSNASGVQDIIFDGERTIYGSISTGLVKIDTETLVATTLTTIAAGGSYLGIDHKYVYVASRTASTTPSVAMVSRSSFTVSATFTSGTALTVASGWGTPVPDYSGSCFVTSQAGTTASQTLRMAKFTSDTGATLVNTANILRNAAATTQNDFPSAFYIDRSSGRLYLVQCATTTGRIYELDPTLLTALQTVTTMTTAATGTPLASQLALSTTLDYRGDLNIIPIRGVFYVSPKRVGISTAAWQARIHFNYPLTSPSGIPAFSAVSTAQITTTPLGHGGTAYTNTVRIYNTYSVTPASDNRIYYINQLYNVTNIAGNQSGRLLVKG